MIVESPISNQENENNPEYISRSNQLTAAPGHGKAGSLLFSAIITGFGVVLLSLTRFRIPQEDDELATFLALTAGLVISAIGLPLLYSSVAAIFRNTRKKNRSAYANVWEYDYPWNTEYLSCSNLKEVITLLISGVFVTGIFCVFLPLWKKAEWTYQLIPLIFLAIIWFAVLRITYTYIRIKEVRLRMSRFPFHPGQSVTLELENSYLLKSAEEYDITIRFLEEKWVTVEKAGGKKVTKLKCRVHYADKKKYKVTNHRLIIPFHVPENGPETELSSTKPKYWELVIHGNSKRDIAWFYLPVYKVSSE